MLVENMLVRTVYFADHVTVSFARSGGPGGQNVNKGLLMLFYFIVFSSSLLNNKTIATKDIFLN